MSEVSKDCFSFPVQECEGFHLLVRVIFSTPRAQPGIPCPLFLQALFLNLSEPTLGKEYGRWKGKVNGQKLPLLSLLLYCGGSGSCTVPDLGRRQHRDVVEHSQEQGLERMPLPWLAFCVPPLHPNPPRPHRTLRLSGNVLEASCKVRPVGLGHGPHCTSPPSPLLDLPTSVCSSSPPSPLFP